MSIRFAKPTSIRNGRGERSILPHNWLYASGMGYISIPDADTVLPTCVCPGCSEDRVDWLGWIDDNVVECQTCDAHYDPNEV